MLTDLPAPLTPADCDLRGLPYMPLDVIRLLDSDMFAEATGDEFKAAVALWCKSWTQIPAASLPNKDKVLAHLSGNAERWKKIKEGAMRGWILCSDDRWYHPVVAEKALLALPAREDFQGKKSADAERKAKEREDRKALFKQLASHGIVPEWNASTKHLRDIAKGLESQDVRDNPCDMSQQVTVSKGEGEVKGELTTSPIPPDGGKPSRKTSAIALPTFLANCKTEGCKPIPANSPVIAYAKSAGIPDDFLRLQWCEFKDRYADGSKRYKDWRAVFGKSVRGNWFRLWFAEADGTYKLTTTGLQAENTHREKKQ